MEVVIPFESLEIQNVSLEEPKRLKSFQPMVERSLSNISYTTRFFQMPHLAVLTPVVRVHTWDFSSGRLELQLSSSFYQIFSQFQSTLVSLVPKQQDIYFHPMLQNSILTIYVHTLSDEKKTLLYREKRLDTITEHSFQPNQPIRISIRFQGICFFTNVSTNEKKYRIQYQTRAIYVEPFMQ